MLTPLISIIILISSGYIAKHTKIISGKNASIFMDYLLYFALPALIFDKMYHVDINNNLIGIITIGLISSSICGVAAFFICKILNLTQSTAISAMLLAMFGNTIFIGMPVITGFFGESSINEIIFYDQFATAIPISIIGPFILSFGAKIRVSLIKNIVQVLKFPPFIALILGFSLRGFELPQAIFEAFRLLGDSVVPIALFAIGVLVEFKSLKYSCKSAFITLFCKMVLTPILFVLISVWLGVKFNEMWIIGLLECAMPPMVLGSVMVIKAGLDSDLAISAVAMGVAFSFINLPLIYYLAS